MATIETEKRQTFGNLSQSLRISSTPENLRAELLNPDAPRVYRREVYKCAQCKDMGWLYAVDHKGEPIWNNGTKIVRCDCQRGVDVQRQKARLEALDGLNETERNVLFEYLHMGHNGSAIRDVEAATAEKHGLITLTGRPGTGKTTLLMAAVNAARNDNTVAVYTTMTDILDHLRQAYAPTAPALEADKRWDLLVRADVLAIDELDEFKTTPWANEKFLRLMDERWRRMDKVLTLMALNSPVSALPDKVASRLQSRGARVIVLIGPDMRRA